MSGPFALSFLGNLWAQNLAMREAATSLKPRLAFGFKVCSPCTATQPAWRVAKLLLRQTDSWYPGWLKFPTWDPGTSRPQGIKTRSLRNPKTPPGKAFSAPKKGPTTPPPPLPGCLAGPLGAHVARLKCRERVVLF